MPSHTPIADLSIHALRQALHTQAPQLVADRFQVHRSTIYRWRRRLGIGPSTALAEGYRDHLGTDILRCLQAHPEGLCTSVLARLLNTSRQNVHGALRHTARLQGLITRHGKCWVAAQHTLPGEPYA